MKLKLFCISNKRMLVRLGEYDQSTTNDGEHQDIPIDHAVKHKKFDFVNMIYDIAIIHLAHDVDFNGDIQISPMFSQV